MIRRRSRPLAVSSSPDARSAPLSKCRGRRDAPGSGAVEPGATIRYGRNVSNKVSRAKRKDLRSRGQLPSVVRVAEERRATERRAVEEDASERVHAARDEIAEERVPPRAFAKKPRRDLTLVLLAGLVAAAALIFWLTQRSPTKETKIDAVPRSDAPISGEPVKPSIAAPTVLKVPLAVTPAPAITPTAAPAITAAPALTAPSVLTAAPPATAPAKPHERPAEKAAPRPDKPKAPPKPAGASPDPYG